MDRLKRTKHSDPKCEFDDSIFIAHVLVDISMMHGEVYNLSAAERDYTMVSNAVAADGVSFLTKRCASLGKAFDRALAGGDPLDASLHGFTTMPDSKLPEFLGELVVQVLSKEGTLLPTASAQIVGNIRQVLYLFYKYQLPYSNEQEQFVLDRFKRTEEELSRPSHWNNITSDCDAYTHVDQSHRRSRQSTKTLWQIVEKQRSQREVTHVAKILLKRLFDAFDPKDIYPRNGPGAVAQKQRPWEKFVWTNVSAKIASQYPVDEYYYASMGAVCDNIQAIQSLGDQDLPARVILVPKDSRGPRLISAEPVDYQWIQQGLSRAIVELVEHNPLTKWNVFFTDQAPNQRGALLGSSTGRYVTLDLNEASDRVSLDLVRLLFPDTVLPYLEACRTSSTLLPNGEILQLKKFAPMGSALCFPVLALTIWAILTAGASDEDTRCRILVYGDDVIAPTAYAERAMELLESYGLKINRDKSCTSGLFRESCGTDAFNGVTVTPVRLRTVWSSSRSPRAFLGWLDIANRLWETRYYYAYNYIVSRLHRIYGAIPSEELVGKTAPSLKYVPDHLLPKQTRIHTGFQKKQYRVWDVKALTTTRNIPGWSKLLRFFTEKDETVPWDDWVSKDDPLGPLYRGHKGLRMSQYTQRGRAKLVRVWR